MRTRRKLLACALAPIIGLLIAEVVVRVTGRRPQPLHEVQGSLFAPVDDEIIRFENNRNGKQIVTYPSPDGESFTRITMTTNGQRFRGRVARKNKKIGSLRIACIGDSHTFGYGVADDQTWPAELQNRAVGDVEVLNCGVNAYDTLQELRWYERRVQEFEPDVVLVAYFVNDIAARGLSVREGSSRWLYKITHPRTEGWIQVVRRHSRLADLVCDGVYRHKIKATMVQEDRYKNPDDPGLLRAQEALIGFRDLCAERGTQLHVLLYPYVRPGETGFLSDESLKVIHAFCDESGIACFDASPGMFESWDGETELQVNPLDFHAGEPAHDLFADEVAEYLSGIGLPFLRPPGPGAF